MPSQNRSARGKTVKEDLGKVKMKVSRITQWRAGLKVLKECKNPAIVHGRVRDDVEKQWMKNNNKMKNKNDNKVNEQLQPTSQKPQAK